MIFEDATGAPWSGGSDLFQCRDHRRTATHDGSLKRNYRQNTLTGWLGLDLRNVCQRTWSIPALLQQISLHHPAVEREQFVEPPFFVGV